MPRSLRSPALRGAAASLLVAGALGCGDVVVDSALTDGGAGDASSSMPSMPCDTVITLAAGIPGPATLALQGDILYWMTQGASAGGQIMKVALAGGTPTVVDHDTGSSQAFPFAADTANLYWLNGGVWRAPAGGGATSQYSLWSWASTSAPPVIDAENLYYLQGTEPSGLQAMPLGATDPGPTTIAPDDGGSALAQDADTLYWVTDTTVMKVSKSGGAPTTLASGNRVQQIALDAENVYYTDSSDPIPIDAGAEQGYVTASVMKVPKTGGPPSTIVSRPSLGPPSALVADGAHVYWTEFYGSVITEQGGGRLMMARVTGGSSAMISAAGVDDTVIACPGGVCWTLTPAGAAQGSSLMRFVACP